jgi:CBS domain-containing protein
MTVRDIATTGIETAGPDTTAEALALRMEEVGVGSIVVETDMEPVGIVTDRDLAVKVLAAGHAPDEVTAAEIMTETPVTVEADEGILTATNAMAEHAVRRLPVVDDDELVGIVTMDDLIVLLVAELGNLSRVVEAESPTY